MADQGNTSNSTGEKILLKDQRNVNDETNETKRSNAINKVSDVNESDAPDGGYGWVIVIVSFLATTVVDGVINSFGLFLAELVNEFGVSKGKIAWVGSILTGITLLVGPVASAMTNKFGCRFTCITGSLLSSAAFGLSIFCPTVAFLMATYLVAGIGFGFILLPSSILVGYYFNSRRALATGIALSGSGFGTFIFPPIINYIIRISNWKVANLCLAAAALSCSIFGALMIPLKPKNVLPLTENSLPIRIGLTKNEESRSTIDVSFSNMAEYMLYREKNSKTVEGFSRNRSQSNVADYYAFRRRNAIFTRQEIFYSGSLMQLNIPGQRNNKDSSQVNLKSIFHFNLLKNRHFLLFGLVNVFAMISFYIPLVYIVDDAETKNIKAGQASLLLSVIGIVNTVARIIFGFIVNFPMVESIFVNNICLLIGGAAVGLLPFCQTFTAYVFASIFFGLSIAAYSSLTPIILVDILGIGELTNGFGIIQLFRGVMALLGTPMAGAILDWTHTYSIPFFVGGGLFLISTTFGLILQSLRSKVETKDCEIVT